MSRDQGINTLFMELEFNTGVNGGLKGLWMVLKYTEFFPYKGGLNLPLFVVLNNLIFASFYTANKRYILHQKTTRTTVNFDRKTSL